MGTETADEEWEKAKADPNVAREFEALLARRVLPGMRTHRHEFELVRRALFSLIICIGVGCLAGRGALIGFIGPHGNNVAMQLHIGFVIRFMM